ncbi:SDR family oxidoreductase [Actinomadura sp. NEAU-AAG7]|uniref:SDR family oxidoreductase n=1 Tax=Actinomadura sp. NEAU-AAG7 TaxID=2839640 RepID=UPI001BE4D87A|nr:SDR family oxidoreductase [Actinomadura sp. NEAU-AAG7]MBT2209317.1 SDR family oxidoreductase [Actinomadura sp. NEAU-AAG7]
MKIAVIGGSGLVGRRVVELLDGRAEVASVCGAAGVDLRTGAGLDEALEGAGAVVDVLDAPLLDAEGAPAFFRDTMLRLTAAAERAGVGHHVLLSIVGVDRIVGSPRYIGKRVQEVLTLCAPAPATVVRATQFHGFAEQVASWSRRSEPGKADIVTVPPLLVQPCAVDDVARVLVGLALDGPAGEQIIEVAGPGREDLVDMARRTFAARGDEVRIVPSWDGPFGTEYSGDVLLPGPGARLLGTGFERWLAERSGYTVE